jgi:hypothetical protein
MIEYTHNNPVRAKLVAMATEWEWSSARDWAAWPDVRIRVERTLPTLYPLN